MGKGIKYEIDDSCKMTIIIDTNVEFGKSASGKSTIIASSSGNQPVSYTHLTLTTNREV